MLSQVIESFKKSKISFMLAGMGFFCFSISIIRLIISDSVMFLFLNWNLFLAFIPLFVSRLMAREYFRKKKLFFVLLLFTWIIFFPNAPYILTDLFHLRIRTNIPVWFDLILILSFAWTGLIAGFVSLLEIEKQLKKMISHRWLQIFIVILLFMAGFGVYIGRYLRWNSWDIISDPLLIFNQVLNRFIQPLSHPRTWTLTIFFGILLNMMYWTLKQFQVKVSD
jgi:uncharacterized membrane protein